MMKMKYKDFEFPSNPSVLKVELSDNVVEKPLFGSDSAVYSISHNAALISGEGCFGEKTELFFQEN